MNILSAIFVFRSVPTLFLQGGPQWDMDCFQVTGGENGHLIIFNGCLRWIPLQRCNAIYKLGEVSGLKREEIRGAHAENRLFH